MRLNRKPGELIRRALERKRHAERMARQRMSPDAYVRWIRQLAASRREAAEN